jgi:hypothetical protein
MKQLKINSIINVLSMLFLMGISTIASASSHREAPLISNDPLADNCDVYAFRSPNNPNKVTLIATYVPMQFAQGGPNYYSFGENIRYEVHVDNNVSTAGDDITYRFTFHKMNQDPSTFFNIRLGAQNLKTTYTMEKSTNGGMTWSTIITNGIVPPPNIGVRSIEGGAGLNSSFSSLFNNAITTSTSGEKVFCGSVDDPFFVDLGGVFDLGDMPRQGGNTPKDGLKFLNVSAIAIEVDIADLQKNGQPVSAATSILDPNYVIGVWASASRQKIKTISTNGSQSYSGPWVQVSRLGMPLTNEAVIPIGKKDLWNSITPYQDLAYLDTFKNYFYNPELALYMDDALFGGAVPAFAQLRIQRNSLQAFDFGNGHDGLFGLKGSPAVAGTALDDAIFGTLLLPAAGSPRSVDLWPIFHTGVPNLAPYHLATGKGGNPLANGKPFINNFLPNGGDMLRLNMAVPITPRTSPDFSSDGLIQAAVLGLTNPTYNGTTTLQFIPNMDGFPNGRRLEDDVTRIELQAVGGAALAAIGLWYDDYTAGNPNPVTTDLVDVLSYNTGINQNDTTFSTLFPFVQQPWRGTGEAGGLAVNFTEAATLPNVTTATATNSYTWMGTTYTSSGTYTGATLSCVPEVLNLTITCPPQTAAIITTPIMVNANSANVTWTAVPGATIYYLWYRKVGSVNWLTPSTSATSLILNGLDPNTNYECKIRNNNAACNQFGMFGLITTFTTLNIPCGTAALLNMVNIVPVNKAQISWTALPNAAQYSVWYKLTTATNWSTALLAGSATSFTTASLPQGTYEVKIRNKCVGSNAFTPFSAVTNFTIGGVAKPNEINSNEASSFTIYPNPTKGIVNIEFNSTENSKTTIKIFDFTGRIMKQMQIESVVGINKQTIDLTDFSNGAYLIQIYDNVRLTQINKITKTK